MTYETRVIDKSATPPRSNKGSGGGGVDGGGRRGRQQFSRKYCDVALTTKRPRPRSLCFRGLLSVYRCPSSDKAAFITRVSQTLRRRLRDSPLFAPFSLSLSLSYRLFRNVTGALKFRISDRQYHVSLTSPTDDRYRSTTTIGS